MSSIISAPAPDMLMTTMLSYPHIVLHRKHNLDVMEARIEGRRISVANIAHWYYKEGDSAEYIAQEYDLTSAEVHAALAYYHDHRSEIDRQEAVTRLWAENMAITQPSVMDFQRNLNNHS